ncbi:hypothetical protein HYDPIDRAFT_145368 [Hydnomerulius pinastri MD-312]|nr:hypothetical protein HYDPIDRAFT_145368 [Hydnomerulius pinastri MD-312]
MSTVEAAASLFGSDGDSGPDPFAVIGNEDTDTSTHSLPNHEQNYQNSSSYPLDMGQDASSLFADQMYPDAHAEQHDPWSIPTTQDTTSLAHSQPLNGAHDQQQGYYPEANYSSGYEPHNAYAPQPVPRSPYANTSSNHEPHNSAPAASYQPYGNTQYPSQQYAPAQTNYDLYKPTTTTTSSTYAPQQPASQHSAVPSQQPATYDQYKPVSRSVSSPYSPTFAVTPQQHAPSVSAVQPASVPPTPSASAFRPKTLNAYDPPLPPPKVSKRAVSARNPRSTSPAVGHQTYPVYGQTPLSPPPVPPVPALPPPPPAGNSRYGSLSAASAPPPRPPSGPPPPQRQPTLPYNPNQYGAPSGRDYQNGSHVPSSAQEHYGLPPPEQREPPVSQPSRFVPPPPLPDSHLSSLSSPQPSYNQDPPEGTPTPRQTSNSMFNAPIPASDPTPPQTHEQQQPETQPVYTSDDMPWDDPEGGLEGGDLTQADPFSLGHAEDPYAPYSKASSDVYSPYQPPQSQTPPPKVASPQPALAPVAVEVNGSAGPPTSPPRAKGHQRQDTVVPNGRASPKPPSTHSRAGSSGSSASSVRSPVNRVSSPLRHAIDPHGQETAYPVNAPPKVPHSYDPSSYTPHRTASPSSLRSVSSQQGVAPPVAPPNSYVPPLSNAPPANPYDPKLVSGPQRTMSPSSLRSSSPAPDPYAPPKTVSAYATSQFRGRSASNGSTLSSSGALDIPQQRSEYGLGFRPHLGEPSSYGSVSAYSMAQDVHMNPATRPPYAPSPSLLGSNDPLGRTAARAPIISFGFGGKMLTCFHGSADLSTGFDVALSSRRTTNVTVRVLHKVLPEYALEAKAAEYPGPLFSDPGSPVAGLVRTGASTQVKTKKARVIKYLEERAEEISRGTTYISDQLERQHLEGKLVLVQLLKVMVENDGNLSGSPQIDAAVRAALLPRIAGSIGEAGQDGAAVLSTPAFASPMPNAYAVLSTLPPGNETPVSVSTLLPSSLDKIQEFLVRGERRQAYHYALDEKLWAHAMIIASSIDKDAWKEVVNEFLKGELGVHDGPQRATLPGRGKDVSSQTNGREWLRVAYSLFSGQGPAAVQELVPTSLLTRATTGLQVPAPALSHITPMSPNFPSAAAAAQIPTESLSKWPEITATMVSSPLNPEWSATLTALGDYLASHSLVEGAHACYLLSPQTSTMGGIGSPGARMVLLGSQSPHTKPTFFRDSDPIIFSEIAEFAFSLKTPAKGQELFHGFPHLQAYKLIRAAYLAEMGHLQIATRYCEAITTAMSRPSPYFTPAMVEALKNLADRLIGAPHLDKSASWIGGKMSKPSLDSIGGWLENRLTKFIAGEGDEPSPAPIESANALPSASAGPFATYSSISSATTSASPSPPPTMVNSYSMSATQPPRRSGSAMAFPSTQTHIPIDRASSAMEYRPARNASPAPPKTAPLHSMGYPYSPYVPQTNGHAMGNGYAPAYGSEPLSRKTSLEITAEEGPEVQSPAQDGQPQEVEQHQQTGGSGGWWDSLGSADSAPTPTAATFHPIDDVRGSTGGFISLMDDPALSVTPSPSAPPHARLDSGYEDDEDDLGLGNSSRRKQEGAKANGDSKPTAAPAQQAPKVEEKQDASAAPPAAASGSWLSRFWKKSDAPAPIKASLGEETTFYYDKELKRWVNKKAGAEVAPPSTLPPPPSRAQTASPGRTGGPHPNGITNGTASAPPPLAPPHAPPHAPPLARPASSIDLSTSPTAKAPMRVRSNLVPTEVASMPNTPAPGMGTTPPPPMGRPRSQAAKKNVRTRYVDVFQQEGGAA